MDDVKEKRIYEALIKSWSIETSSKWTIENPAKGQCGVTALVVQDIYGGEIKKTKAREAWHFYNFIDGQRFGLKRGSNIIVSLNGRIGPTVANRLLVPTGKNTNPHL